MEFCPARDRAFVSPEPVRPGVEKLFFRDTLIVRLNILTGALVVSLSVVLILPVASFFFFVPAYHGMLTNITEEESLRVASHLAASITTNGSPIHRQSLRASDHQEISALVKHFKLSKLRLFSDTGEIVFSTESEEIGSRINQDYFYEVVARGKALSKTVRKDSPSLEGQVQSVDVVETYVPIMEQGRFMGAFEIYYMITERKEEYDWVISRYLYTVFVATLILLAAVLLTAYKAKQYLSRRYRAEQELRAAHAELESRVRQRTAELKESNESLRQENEMRRSFEAEVELAAEVIDSVIEGICVTDTSGTIERVNRRFTEITGYTAKEAVGDNPRILKSDRHDPEFYEKMWRSLIQTGRWQGEIWNRRKNGEVYREWLSISSIRNSDRQVSHYVGVFYEVRQLLEKQEQLSRKAYHDTLTKLANRELFFERLEEALVRAGRLGRKLAVFFVDLDDFKTINDSLGHQYGDVLLKGIAERLLFCCREEDTVARFGGDEFVMLLTNVTDRQDVVGVAKRIFSHLAVPIVYQEKEMAIKASVGIALFPEDDSDAAGLVNKADAAMYQTKKQGKNSYHFWRADDDAA